jgi:maleate isomerase
VREVSVQNPDAVVIMCTNLKGAQLAPALEVELGVPIFDSVSAFVWQALVLGKVDPSPLSGWGRLFGGQRE